MLEGAALNWVLVTAGGTAVAGMTALVKKVYQNDDRIALIETKLEERDRAVLARLDSLDDSLSALTTFLLNQKR